MTLTEPHKLPDLIALLFGLWKAFTPNFSTAKTLNERRDKVLDDKLEMRNRFFILKSDWLPICHVENMCNIGIVFSLILLVIIFWPGPNLYLICWLLAVAGASFKFVASTRADLIDYREMRDSLKIPKETPFKEWQRVIWSSSLREPSG